LTLINNYETTIDAAMASEYGGGGIYETSLSGTLITGSVVIGELRRRYMTEPGQNKRFRWTYVSIVVGDGFTAIKMRNANYPYVRR